MKRISMLTLALIAAIVAAAIAQVSNIESKAANPTQGKFGRTLLKIATTGVTSGQVCGCTSVMTKRQQKI
jgi:hypothetical protein